MIPSVSIITPVYNSGKFILDSAHSVLRQSYPDFELILIDDRSSDDSLELAQSLAREDERIRVITLPENVGGGAARNAGISAARGRYVAFLDSDDLWEEQKLAVQLAEMRAKNALLSYTDYSVFEIGGQDIRTIRTPEKLAYRDLLKNPAIGCSTAIYDAGRIGKRYLPEIRKRQDFGLWLSILKDIDFAHRCGNSLTRYRIRQGSVSSNKLAAAAYTWRIYREVEALPFLPSAYYFVCYALAATRKRL